MITNIAYELNVGVFICYLFSRRFIGEKSQMFGLYFVLFQNLNSKNNNICLNTISSPTTTDSHPPQTSINIEMKHRLNASGFTNNGWFPSFTAAIIPRPQRLPFIQKQNRSKIFRGARKWSILASGAQLLNVWLLPIITVIVVVPMTTFNALFRGQR